MRVQAFLVSGAVILGLGGSIPGTSVHGAAAFSVVGAGSDRGADGDTVWARTYGGAYEEYGYSVAQTSDGGYIVVGTTTSFGAGYEDLYIVRTDGAGDTVWTRTYGGSLWDEARSVAQTADGGYVVAGATYSFGIGHCQDFYLMKLDEHGDTVWTRTYGGSDDDGGYSVAQTSDGGYIVAGGAMSFGAGSWDVHLVKTDGAGDTVWTRTYGGSDYDLAYSVAQTSDGGYIVTGQTDSFGAGSHDVYLIKTDGIGDTVWTRVYGGTHWDHGYSVAQTSDGGYIVAGATYSFGPGNYDVYLIKTDGAGDTVWTRTYGGPLHDWGYSLGQTGDGGYVVAGSTESFGGGRDVYLIKTDAAGDTAWTRVHGGPAMDRGSSVAQTADGGYIVAGSTKSFGAGANDIYLLKTDAKGAVQVDGDDDEVPGQRLHYLSQNRPNPFRGTTAISYAIPDHRRVRLAVYDIRGALVRELVRGTLSPGAHHAVWDGCDGRGREVGSGVYFCRLEAGEAKDTKRMVLLR